MLKKMVNYFLEKPGTYEQVKNSTTFSLNLASKEVLHFTKDQPSLTLKMSTEHFNNVKEKYKLLVTGKKNSELFECAISTDMISQDDLLDLIDLSYESVLSILPENEQKEILDLEW